MRSTIELRAVPTGRDVGRISNVVRYVAPLEVTLILHVGKATPASLTK